MSADNGIYILRTLRRWKKDGDSYTNQVGYEYRIAHCQAIENVDHSDLYAVLYFADSIVYYNSDEAYILADRLAAEIEADGGYLEYGVDMIEKDIMFPNMSAKQAAIALDAYEGCIPPEVIENV